MGTKISIFLKFVEAIMQNFALIYNPQTNHTQSYTTIDSVDGDLYFQNFEGSKKFVFQQNPLTNLDNINLSFSSEHSTSKKEYLQWVKLIIQSIRSSELEKAVAAQKQAITFDSSKLDWTNLFHTLIQQLPQTFVYLFYVENTIWLGASPEIIGMQEGGNFSTISLAGTNTQGIFSEKEKQEQGIVSDYILKKMNLQTKDSAAVKMLRYGNLSHLVSEFSIAVDDTFDFEHTIRSIHPSPALAGFPKDKSIRFILNNEPIRREFYCGLVSFMEENNRYSFATIRCAKITQNQMIFYAGAGITIDSNPENEWRETLDKIEVLRKIVTQN